MEDMDLRNSKSNPAFVSGIDKPEKILHHRNDTKSSTTARGEMSNSNTPAGPSNHTSMMGMMEKDREPQSFVVSSHQ